MMFDYVDHRGNDVMLHFTDGSRYDLPLHIWEALVQTDMEEWR